MLCWLVHALFFPIIRSMYFQHFDIKSERRIGGNIISTAISISPTGRRDQTDFGTGFKPCRRQSGNLPTVDLLWKKRVLPSKNNACKREFHVIVFLDDGVVQSSPRIIYHNVRCLDVFLIGIIGVSYELIFVRPGISLFKHLEPYAEPFVELGIIKMGGR